MGKPPKDGPSRPVKGTMAPVMLDEEDGLMAVVPETPTDGKFRRGLFVMFVVVGIMVASALIQVRETSQDLQDAKAGQIAAERQVRDLLVQQAEADRKATERFEEASNERAALARRSAGLERLLIAVLANSTDPILAEAFTELANTEGISTRVTPGTIRDLPPAPRLSPRASAAPRPQAQPRPSAAPRPSASPRPSPAPSPTRPVPAIVPRVCATTLVVNACTP